ncbi:MAG: Mth938-like domain-containing protein [Sphingomonas sp.]|nr:Mth938-like domain-containing protein [Sphingomonas sp.]
MRMTREAGAEGPLISGFSGRGFRIDDHVYLGLLITPDSADSWSPPPIEALDEAALAPLLALDPLPEFLLIGTGSAMRRPPPALVAALDARGIGVEAMDSRAAARAWGVLRAERRQIAGAFYPL